MAEAQAAPTDENETEAVTKARQSCLATFPSRGQQVGGVSGLSGLLLVDVAREHNT